jgi:hypothetical protein
VLRWKYAIETSFHQDSQISLKKYQLPAPQSPHGVRHPDPT